MPMSQWDPLLKSVGKLWETLGLITETFVFTRKGLIRLLPAENVLICFAFQYDEILTHSTLLWIGDSTVDTWITMNSFYQSLLLPIHYNDRNYAASSTIQKDTMWCGDVIYDLGVNNIGQSEYCSICRSPAVTVQAITPTAYGYHHFCFRARMRRALGL